jgi:hypothetical protein
MYFPFEAKRCPQFLRHKQSLLTPALLERHGVPFIRGIQQAGEFMVTFPRYSFEITVESKSFRFSNISLIAERITRVSTLVLMLPKQ